MSSTPVGSIVAYGGDASAQMRPLEQGGWLLCDGRAVSRRVYSTLFGIIGTKHGSGDGSTTFNLPDLRGRFLRGTSRGTGRDPDAASRPASAPGGSTGDATGSVQGTATARPTKRFTTDQAGNHSHSVAHVPVDNSSYATVGSHYGIWNEGGVTTSQAGAHYHAIDGGGDAESRPPNGNVDFIICFQ
jgi:microcystin-dependent protein